MGMRNSEPPLAYARRYADLPDPIHRGAYASWWMEERGTDAPVAGPAVTIGYCAKKTI